MHSCGIKTLRDLWQEFPFDSPAVFFLLIFFCVPALQLEVRESSPALNQDSGKNIHLFLAAQHSSSSSSSSSPVALLHLRLLDFWMFISMGACACVCVRLFQRSSLRRLPCVIQSQTTLCIKCANSPSGVSLYLEERAQVKPVKSIFRRQQVSSRCSAQKAPPRHLLPLVAQSEEHSIQICLRAAPSLNA